MKIVVNEPRTVVLWSGGVDSTGALYKILKEHPDEVFAHHIHFKNKENRWGAEKESVDKMIPWLKKNVRDFEYSESTIEIDLRIFGWDVMTAMYIGGIVTQDKKCNKLVVGAPENVSPQTPPSVWRVAIGQILAMCAGLRAPHISQSLPAFWHPLNYYTKKEIWSLLPDFLKENIWGCRTPKQSEGKWVECEDCITCNSLKELR